MGRFDALTKLENDKQKDVKPPTVDPSSSLQIKSGAMQTNEIKKPANPQAGKTASPLTRKPARLKTRKPTSQQKGLLLSKNL